MFDIIYVDIFNFLSLTQKPITPHNVFVIFRPHFHHIRIIIFPGNFSLFLSCFVTIRWHATAGKLFCIFSHPKIERKRRKCFVGKLPNSRFSIDFSQKYINATHSFSVYINEIKVKWTLTRFLWKAKNFVLYLMIIKYITMEKQKHLYFFPFLCLYFLAKTFQGKNQGTRCARDVYESKAKWNWVHDQ